MKLNDTIRQTAMLIILLCGAGIVQADYSIDGLGKLFTDKQERKKIDDRRSGKSEETVKKTTDNIKVQGYVKRSGGKSVVWINNKNTLKSNKVDDVKIHQSSIGNNKSVTVTVDGKVRRLKPGETWHKSTSNTPE